MKYSNLFKILPLVFFMLPPVLRAETDTTAPKKNHSLEEMSVAELKEALKKSHSEIESRLGPASTGSTEEISPEKASRVKAKTLSLSEKRAYEASAQSRIDLLNYKIRSLETAGNKNWGYSVSDASRLRTIKSNAQDQLTKIRSDNTEGWKTHKQILDGLLRDAASY